MRKYSQLLFLICFSWICPRAGGAGSNSSTAACPGGTGCQEWGTCNEELNRCDCPPFPVGPQTPDNPCGVTPMPSCRPDPESNPLFQMPCSSVSGERLPCECLAECFDHGIFWSATPFACWRMDDPELEGLTTAEKWTRARKGEADLYEATPENVNRFKKKLDPAKTEKNYKLRFKPQFNCAKGCSGHGVCVMGSCQCFPGFKGSGCEKPQYDMYCSNGCSGKGKCLGGFCKCDAGFWGIDCSLSKGANGEVTTMYERWAARVGPKVPGAGATDKPGPRIYVYELPPRFNSHLLYHHSWFRLNSIYSAGRFVLDRLLHSEFREVDPQKADYFFVPMWPRVNAPGWPRRRSRNYYQVHEYLSKEYPYWNRTGGRDHIFLFPDDRGACDEFGPMPNARVPALENSIFLTHFGWTGGSLAWNAKEEGCFRPGHDIVIPPAIGLPRIPRSSSPRVPGALQQTGEWLTRFDGNKPDTLFFVGAARLEGRQVYNKDKVTLAYSHGVRQRVVQTFHGVPGFAVKDGRTGNYNREMMSSKFCLAPAGAGWGIRLAEVIINGCVPVVIQDNVTQPFEELLPYARFALRFNEDQIPDLKRLLTAISDDGRKELVKELKCAWKALVWSSVHGSIDQTSDDGTTDAFAMTMFILKTRLAAPNSQQIKARFQLPASLEGKVPSAGSSSRGAHGQIVQHDRTYSIREKLGLADLSTCQLMKHVSAEVYPSYKPLPEEESSFPGEKVKLCPYPRCPDMFRNSPALVGPASSSWPPGGAAAVSRPFWEPDADHARPRLSFKPGEHTIGEDRPGQDAGPKRPALPSTIHSAGAKRKEVRLQGDDEARVIYTTTRSGLMRGPSTPAADDLEREYENMDLPKLKEALVDELEEQQNLLTELHKKRHNHDPRQSP